MHNINLTFAPINKTATSLRPLGYGRREYFTIGKLDETPAINKTAREDKFNGGSVASPQNRDKLYQTMTYIV